LVEAQPATRIPRIGYLAFFGRTSFDDTFRDGLRDLGYVDGRNIMIEYRSADANLERVRELAAELVRLNPDLIVTSTGESYVVSCPRARRPRRRARAHKGASNGVSDGTV
jgi:hypothetical protein